MDDATLAQLLGRGFDFLCDRRLSDFIDAPKALEIADTAATRERVGAFVRRFVAPVRTRVLAELRKSDRALGEWLPEPARAALADLMGAPVALPPELVEELVASPEVRESARDILREAISGTFGRATRGSGLLSGAASLIGGLGGDLAEKFAPVVDAGVAIVQKKLAARLTSPDVARGLGKRRRKAFETLLKKTEADAAKFADRVPHALLDALTPEVVVHNQARAELRAVVLSEVEAVLADLSTQTIGALLDEYGLRGVAREQWLARGLPLVREFVKSLGAQQQVA